MNDLAPGVTGSFRLVVEPEHLANQFKDPILPPVLATPVMIMLMENAALNAIGNYLAPGESAVGTLVNIRHLAPTPVGQQITATAKVTEVDGRRIAFVVSAYDEVEEIGNGVHERMTVDLQRLEQRLSTKRRRS